MKNLVLRPTGGGMGRHSCVPKYKKAEKNALKIIFGTHEHFLFFIHGHFYSLFNFYSNLT